MKQEPANLPDDPAALKEMVRSLVTENWLLEEKLSLLEARLFGRSSEKGKKHDDAQGELFDEAEVAAGEDDDDASNEAEQETITYTRNKPKRRPLPEHLPRKDVIHDVTDEHKQCACGCAKTCINEVVSEKLCIRPAKV